MTQTDTAQTFHTLHQPETPLILYNVWDAATAKACVAAGAKAVATGSHSVAEAQGYPDGQAVPFDHLCLIAERIAARVDVPVSVDFEAGYGEELSEIADNLKRLIDVGVVGVNFEDQIVGGDGLRDVGEQAARIEALRAAADARGVSVFINARTDLFLKEPDADRHADLLEDAVSRAAAYAKAGASGFFVPRLADGLVAELCERVSLPVNIMATAVDVDVEDLSKRGVSRISHGPFPFIDAMAAFEAKARVALG